MHLFSGNSEDGQLWCTRIFYVLRVIIWQPWWSSVMEQDLEYLTMHLLAPWLLHRVSYPPICDLSVPHTVMYKTEPTIVIIGAGLISHFHNCGTLDLTLKAPGPGDSLAQSHWKRNMATRTSLYVSCLIHAHTLHDTTHRFTRKQQVLEGRGG